MSTTERNLWTSIGWVTAIRLGDATYYALRGPQTRDVLDSILLGVDYAALSLVLIGAIRVRSRPSLLFVLLVSLGVGLLALGVLQAVTVFSLLME